MESLLLKLRNTLNKAFWVIVKIKVSPYTRGSVLNYSAVKSKLYLLNNFKKR